MSAGLLDTATARVAAAYARIAEVDRPEVWITLRPESELVTEAAELERRIAAGEELPLAGLLVAVKDNVDVSGLPTTAGSTDPRYDDPGPTRVSSNIPTPTTIGPT
ncbi:amidase family protein, partial [Amycolatopsis sp. NPDC003676]